MQTTTQLKKNLSKSRLDTIVSYPKNPRPHRLLTSLSREVDLALTQLWNDLQLSHESALVAVGGYGREELFPYSDVDILLLIHQKPNEIFQKQLEHFVQLSWDLGLRIGHSIRTIAECLTASKKDITIQTSLLEARLITGSSILFNALKKAFDEAMNAQDFFLAKTLELKQRHQKLDNTPFSLEPNCKESPGGLRDLQVILWTAKAAKFGNSWTELAKNKLITQEEASQLIKHERVIQDIRIRLHTLAGRAEDRLLFDFQIPLAKAFLFKKGINVDPRIASDALMKHYYLAARAISQLNNILLQNLEARLFPQTYEITPINLHFNKVGNLIDISENHTFTKDPSTIFEVFVHLSNRSDLKNMTARTQRALWHARRHIDKSFRQNKTNHRLFLEILKAPLFSARALQHMNELGVLGKYLLPFGRIIGQMQHDLFHQYTVDQHILIVIANIHRFTLTEYAHEYPFCSQLIANFSKPWVIYIAALFHDIAKGREGDHSKLGVEDARHFCTLHDICEEDTNLILFLVEHHLTMSDVAQKQDLSDPEVVYQFSKIVKTERRLSALYLLTIADIRGTNPLIWNAWKSKLLEDLYHVTLRILGGEAISIDNELAQHQREALSTLRLYGIEKHAHEALWKHLDVSYFLRHDASEIAWQTRTLYDNVNADTPIVKCRLSPIGEGLQVTVYAKDEPDLFLKICRYFSKQTFSILDAKIHTTTHHYALDTFQITTELFEQNYRDIINLVEHNLTQALTSTNPIPEPVLGKFSRASRSFPITPHVELQPDINEKFFILAIIATDRRGLLQAIAEIFRRHEIELHTAKIMTLGERVEDTFLISGGFLKIPKNQILLETELLNLFRS